jgi:hypothetical protein
VKINVVITTLNTKKGERAGQLMARQLRDEMGTSDWRMYVHVRKPDAWSGRDDAYAEYAK